MDLNDVLLDQIWLEIPGKVIDLSVYIMSTQKKAWLACRMWMLRSGCAVAWECNK